MIRKNTSKSQHWLSLSSETRLSGRPVRDHPRNRQESRYSRKLRNISADFLACNFTHNKKAQFYIFTMIILLGLVSTFIIANPVSVEVDKSFDNYFENIDRELEYALNNAILYDANVSEEINIFFNHISELGQSRRVDLSYLYLLVNSTNLTFYNSMVSDVYLTDYNVTLAQDSSWTTERSDTEKIAFQLKEGLPNLSTFIYKFYITEEENQVLYLLFAKRGEQYDLHIRDNS